MKLLRLIAVTLLGIGLCAAQIPQNHRTAGMLNGRHWAMLHDADRWMFIEGYGTYVAFGNTNGCKEPTGARFPFSATVEEITKGLNRIYDAPENAGIPIIFALNAFYMRVNGASDVDVVELLRSYREEIHEPKKDAEGLP